MSEDEEPDQPLGTSTLEEYPVEEELNLDLKAIWKRFNQPYVWIFCGVVLLLVIAAFYMGYMRGYEHCINACNERIVELTIIK